MRNVKEIRKIYKLSYRSLATLLACDPSCFTRWEKENSYGQEATARVLLSMDHVLDKFPASEWPRLGAELKAALARSGGFLGGVAKLLEFHQQVVTQPLVSEGVGIDGDCGSDDYLPKPEKKKKMPRKNTTRIEGSTLVNGLEMATYMSIDGRLLCDAETGAFIRYASIEESAESDAEVDAGRPEGIILVDGRRCYVEG